MTAVTALTYARLYFGIDFTDESFYTAVPYRFVLGAQPLIDETNVAQLTPGVLMYPFLKVYEAVAGLDGMMLFTRHLHLFFCIGVSLALFAALRRCMLDGALSAVLAAMAVAFVPFGIHGLSYNTFGGGFFAAGCFLGLAWLRVGSRRSLVLAGAVHGLAVFTYPPFLGPVACFFAALYLCSKPRSLRALAPALVPTVAGGVAVLLFFIREGPGTARALFDRASTYGGQGGGFAKALDVLSTILSAFPHKHVVLLLLFGAIMLRWWRPWLAIIPLFALPLVVLPPDLATSASSNQFVTNFGLLAPFVFLLVPRIPLARQLLAVVWIPSAVGGGVTALSSGNGSINFAIGFFPAAVVTAALVAIAIRGAIPVAVPRLVRALSDLVPVIGVLAIGIGMQYAFVYRDASLSLLTDRIDGGAYAGIYTTARNRDFLAQLDRDLEDASGRRCRILFYDAFPGGYLLGHGRPDTNTALLLDVAGGQEAGYERLLISYYASHGGLPDVAVRMDRIPLSNVQTTVQTYRPSDPLERLLRRPRYVTTRVRPAYRISTRVNASCRTKG